MSTIHDLSRLHFDHEHAELVMRPAAPLPGFWLGAPSLERDERSGRVYLAYRQRMAGDQRTDKPTYRAAVAVSQDGRDFEDIWSITGRELRAGAIGRCCIRRLLDGTWGMYLSYEHPAGSSRWRIDMIRASEPSRFDEALIRPVLRPEQVGVHAVKDPCLFIHRHTYYMLMSAHLTPGGPVPTHLATSRDGLTFAWQGEALGVGGWAALGRRLTCIVPLEGGQWAAYYDGASRKWPMNEEVAGLATSDDLRSWRDATPNGPSHVSRHTRSLRYVDVVEIAGEAFAYYEAATASNAHAMFRNRLLV